MNALWLLRLSRLIPFGTVSWLSWLKVLSCDSYPFRKTDQSQFCLLADLIALVTSSGSPSSGREPGLRGSRIGREFPPSILIRTSRFLLPQSVREATAERRQTTPTMAVLQAGYSTLLDFGRPHPLSSRHRWFNPDSGKEYSLWACAQRAVPSPHGFGVRGGHRLARSSSAE